MTVPLSIPRASSEASISGRCPRSGDAEQDAGSAQELQQLHRAGERPAVGHELRKDLAMAVLQTFRFRHAEIAAQLATRGAREEAAAHPHAAVDAPAVDRQAGLPERALPGKDVRVNRVDQGAVKIKDQCFQVVSLSELV